MNGDLFVQTLRAMENVSSVLLEYLNYARDLTSHSPTSTFKLMERSIIMFNSYMAADFNRAFEWVSKLSQQCRVMSYAQFSKAMCVWLSWTYSVFRNVGNYSRDYDYAFKWNHEARLVLIKVSLLQRQLSQTVRQSFFLSLIFFERTCWNSRNWWTRSGALYKCFDPYSTAGETRVDGGGTDHSNLPCNKAVHQCYFVLFLFNHIYEAIKAYKSSGCELCRIVPVSNAIWQ